MLFCSSTHLTLLWKFFRNILLDTEVLALYYYYLICTLRQVSILAELGRLGLGKEYSYYVVYISVTTAI
jgi:hypothetical protein